MKSLMIILLLLGVVSCKEDKVSVNTDIVNTLQEDLDRLGVEITNEVPLLSTNNYSNNIELITLDNISTKSPTNDFAYVESQEEIIPDTSNYIEDNVSFSVMPVAKSEIPSYRSVKKSTAQPYVVQNEVYIKVGNDIANARIGKSIKITVAVFPKKQVKNVDIYIYAIPTYSSLIRNGNTLIGYAKGLEFINNQAQFTKYWTGNIVDGRKVKSGKYNIYVEYYYKNIKGQIINKKGRYWGGNHRKWVISA